MVLSNVEASGSFVTFQAKSAGVVVTDEVWVAGSDAQSDMIIGNNNFYFFLYYNYF